MHRAARAPVRQAPYAKSVSARNGVVAQAPMAKSAAKPSVPGGKFVLRPIPLGVRDGSLPTRIPPTTRGSSLPTRIPSKIRDSSLPTRIPPKKGTGSLPLRKIATVLKPVPKKAVKKWGAKGKARLGVCGDMSPSEISHFLQQANVISSRLKAKSTENTSQEHGRFVTTLEWRFVEPGRRQQVWKTREMGASKKSSRAMAAKRMLEDHGLAPKLSVQDREKIAAVKQLCTKDSLDIHRINDAIKVLPPDAYEMFLVDAFRAAISHNCVQQLALPRQMPYKTWSEMLNEATFIMEHDMLSLLKNVDILGDFDLEESRRYYLKYRFLIASERRAQLRQALEGRNEDEYQKLEWHDMRVTDRSADYFTLQPTAGVMPDVVDGDVIVVTAPSIQRPFLCKVTSKVSKGRGPPKINVRALRHEKFTFSCVSVANLEGEVTAVRQIEALDAFAGPQDTPATGKSRFNFHPSMRNALLHVEAADPGQIGVVHGPPGAGKTYTACEIVKNWLRTPERPKILCVTDSNAAADNLHAALKSAGARAVRFQKDPTEECSVARSYNEWVETKDVYMRIKTWRETLERYPVVVTTCSSAGHQSFDNMIFDALILDEATQSTEPSSLIPFGRSVQQSVLIGDPKQLPPTVFETPDLQVTLFDRVDRAQRQESKMFLEEQRRMHPEIMAFPSKQFYDDRLKANIDPPVPIGWPKGAKRVIFREVLSQEESRKSSKCNLAEVTAIKEEVEYLVLADVDRKQSIAVITPYVAQKIQLLRALESFDNVVVNTIDGYQGNEADVVLFSSVRSKKLGFTDDPRRINVALTRAKRGLIVFGRRDIFNQSSIWREWVHWIDELHGVATRKMPLKRARHRELCAGTNEEVTAVADKLFHATVHHTKDWVDDAPDSNGASQWTVAAQSSGYQPTRGRYDRRDNTDRGDVGSDDRKAQWEASDGRDQCQNASGRDQSFQNASGRDQWSSASGRDQWSSASGRDQWSSASGRDQWRDNDEAPPQGRYNPRESRDGKSGSPSSDTHWGPKQWEHADDGKYDLQGSDTNQWQNDDSNGWNDVSTWGSARSEWNEYR